MRSWIETKHIEKTKILVPVVTRLNKLNSYRPSKIKRAILSRQRLTGSALPLQVQACLNPQLILKIQAPAPTSSLLNSKDITRVLMLSVPYTVKNSITISLSCLNQCQRLFPVEKLHQMHTVASREIQSALLYIIQT